VFRHAPEVPPPNHHAAQLLRPAVSTRTGGGCNQTLWGALVPGLLASSLVSCTRQGNRFLDRARPLWPSSAPHALPWESQSGG
jgi:hypothetical protein